MIQTKKTSAFTLIEVMVATVIMVILVGMVITITGRVLDVWTKSSGKLSANAEARIALELLTQDLETAVFRNNGQQWLRVDGPEDTANKSNYESQTVALKLFTPSLNRSKRDSNDDPIPGDVCAVAYRLEYKEAYTGATDKVYALYRSIARADDTFNYALGSNSQGTDSPQLDLVKGGGAGSAVSMPARPAEGQLAGDFWDENNILQSGNYLASNIVDFQVFIYEQDPDDATQAKLMNADSGYKLIDGQDYIYGGSAEDTSNPGSTTPYNTGRLLYADIVLKVVSDEGLEILSLPTLAGTDFADADAVILEHGQTFTRRVYFPASPL